MNSWAGSDGVLDHFPPGGSEVIRAAQTQVSSGPQPRLHSPHSCAGGATGRCGSRRHGYPGGRCSRLRNRTRKLKRGTCDLITQTGQTESIGCQTDGSGVRGQRSDPAVPENKGAD